MSAASATTPPTVPPTMAGVLSLLVLFRKLGFGVDICVDAVTVTVLPSAFVVLSNETMFVSGKTPIDGIRRNLGKRWSPSRKLSVRHGI